MKRLLILAPFALTACSEPIRVNAPPPPQDWMVCQKLPVAPDLKPLTPFQLSDGRTVYLKADVDDRDSQIARYIVQVRGAWFGCWSNLKKIDDYYADTGR